MRHFRFTIAFLAVIFSLAFIQKNYAATFTVTNTNDGGEGSLRQAILDAGGNNEEDTINFDSAVFSTPQVITLTSGALTFNPDNSSGSPKTLTVNAPGANMLTINGNNQNFAITILRDSRVVINGLKISGANGTAILVAGGFIGNGVQNLTLTSSIVSDNHHTSDILASAGINMSGFVTIINSAIVNNSAGFYGGAVYQGHSSVLTIINSTVSNNATTGAGGAIYNSQGTTYLINSTVAFNRSTHSNAGGGGIYLTASGIGSSVWFYPRNSIIAKNTANSGFANNISGTVFSQGYNIIGEINASQMIPDETSQINVDPLLDPSLSAHGGIIPTHALNANSPAIDRGTNCVLTTTDSGGCVNVPVTTDVRGVSRPQDADGNGTATVDIGAFEAKREEILNAPAVAPDLLAASDSGISDSDNITAQTNITFEVGGVTSGAFVELLRNGVVVSSATAGGGVLTMSDPTAVNGTHGYAARQTINGVTSLPGPGLTVNVDTLAPAVAVNQAANQFDPTTAQPLNFTAVFNEAVIGFDSTDVSLAGSTAGVGSANINVTGSAPTYNIAVSSIFPDGVVTASIPANAVQDLAGNSSVASTSTDNSITLDNTVPTVTVNQAPTQADPTRNSPVNFAVVFSEPVTGFNNADILLTGSTANTASAFISVTGSGTTYNVAISGVTSNGGFVRASVRPQAANDLAGNPSEASWSTDNEVAIDNTSPTVTINQAVEQTDPTANLPVNFTVVFSEPVTGFGSASDISLAGSSVNTSQATVTITGGGTTYNVAVGGNIVSNGGLLQVRVNSGAAQDALGNFNLSSTSTDNTVRIDNVSPSVTINQAIGQADPASAQPINFTVVFSEIVNGFTAADVSLAGSTANVSSAVINVTGGGSVYTVSVSGVTSTGQVRASLPAGAATDAVGNPTLASTGTDNTVSVIVVNRSHLFDFDGDGKTDISIFRPSNGEWWYSKSGDNQTAVLQFGLETDKLVPTDFTGDRKTDIAVFRPATGEWFVLRSEDFSFYSIPFGQADDVPAVGDFDGDGKGDLTVFRPSDATWYIQLSSGGYAIQPFGAAGDVPAVGDYDGDGKSDLAVFRPSDGSWWYQRSSDGQARVFAFGNSTDKPVPGDFTGDGKTDLAVWRPSTGEWFVQRSEDDSYFSIPFGAAGDIPAVGDYDGDGKSDAAVFRPSSATWFIQATTAGTLITNFGANGDRPVASAFVP